VNREYIVDNRSFSGRIRLHTADLEGGPRFPDARAWRSLPSGFTRQRHTTGLSAATSKKPDGSAATSKKPDGSAEAAPSTARPMPSALTTPTVSAAPTTPAAFPSLRFQRLPAAPPRATSIRSTTRPPEDSPNDPEATGTDQPRIVNLVERRKRAASSVPTAPDSKKADIDKPTPAASWTPESLAMPPAASWTPESLTVTRLRAQLKLAHDELAALRNRERYPGPDGPRSPSPSPFELARLARGEVVRTLLPILDDLDRASEGFPPRPNEDASALRLQRIGQDLRDLLERQGLERIASSQGAFDPRRHELVDDTYDPAVPSHTVTAIHRPGYALHGRILRRAQVQVSTTHKDV